MHRTFRCALGLALAPAVLPAQGPFRSIGAGAGVLVPAGSLGQVDNLGWHLLATGRRPLSGRMDLSVDAVFGQTVHEAGIGGSTTLTGATAGVALFLAGETRNIRPFVTVGVGVFRVNVSVPGSPSAAATKFTPAAGAGLVIGSGRRRYFFAARYLSVQTSPQTTAFMPISAGVMLFRGAREP